MTARQFKAWHEWRRSELTREEELLVYIRLDIWHAAGSKDASFDMLNPFRRATLDKRTVEERSRDAMQNSIRRIGSRYRVNYKGEYMTPERYQEIKQRELAAAG